MTFDKTAARFLLVGVLMAAVYFTLALMLASLGTLPFASGIIAFVICAAVGCVMQYSWTFSASTEHARSVPRFVMLQGTSALALGSFCHITIYWFGASSVTMSALATVVGGIVSYFVSRRWVFANAA
jgi:putative flippase GtrA